MRISGNSRTGAAGYAAAAGRSAGTGATFAPTGTAPANNTASAMGVAGLTGIEALLALQAGDDALGSRRKAIKRGRQLLDTLDAMQRDLLAGRVSDGRLNQLLALVGQARDRSLPGLDSVLDDVELRARVELAKFGRFTAA